MRLTLGLLFWVIVIGAGTGSLFAYRHDPALDPGRRLLRYFREDAVAFSVALPRAVEVESHTNVLIEDPVLFLRRIGEVTAVRRVEGKTVLDLEIFPEDAVRLQSGVEATFFTVPASAAWIVSTLIPEDRVRGIQTLWREFYAAERQEIVAALWPVVKESLQEIFRFYENEIPRVIRNNRPDLDALIARHRQGAFEKEFIPALKDVVWDLTQTRLAPLLEDVGRELWDRLPVWGLSWRYMYEYVPFTRKDHVTTRFNAFLERDALPILRARTPHVFQILGQIFRDTIRDPKVVESFRSLVGEVAEDPETLALARKLTSELFLKNDRLLALIRQRWEKKGLKRAVSSVGKRFEPLIRKAVNSIVLDEAGVALNPRLAQVLRSRVLKKEGAWVLLQSAAGAPLVPGLTVAGRIHGE